jgi:adenine-specific DNA methylase
MPADLNPVAVLINKTMIENPPRFAGQAAGQSGVAGGNVGLRFANPT